MIDQILQAIGLYVSQLMAYMTNLVGGLINVVSGFINGIINQIVFLFNTLRSAIQSVLTGILTTISGMIQSTLNTIATYFINAWNLFMQVSVQVLDGVMAFLENAYATIRAGVETIVGEIRGWIEAALATLREFVQMVTDGVVGIINSVRVQIEEVISGVIQAVINAYNATIRIIEQSFDLLFEGATSIIATVNQRIGDLASAFTTSVENLVQGMMQLGEEQFAPIRVAIRAFVDPFVEMLSREDQQNILRVIGQIASPNTLALRTRADAFVLMQNLIPKSGLGRFAWMVVFGIGIILFVYSGVANANAQVILQEFSREYSWQLMSPADIAQAYRRGKLSQQESLELLGRHGYPQPQAAKILDNAENVPAVGDLINFWNRGLLDERTLDVAMFAQGLGPEWQGRIKQASQIIPPVSDLITMAVKEAFSPEIAQRFGQYEDFPPAFAEWARKQGLSDEWARRYWAAHWGLPSVQMGYEMLHRGIISESDLDLLLRSQDVMPFWREKLKQISFATFTRVDIRRMHALGILDETAVVRAYQDIGYDLEKATLMKDFTVQLNAGGSGDDPDDLGKLTRASVLNFYGDGLLTREAAIGLLVEGGATPAGAALYVADVDFEKERKNRNAEISLIVELADAGTITFEEAQDRLTGLGLAEDEVNRALAAILRNQQKKTTLPTKAEAIRWLKKELISIEQFVDLMRRHGFADVWIQLYIREGETVENGD